MLLGGGDGEGVGWALKKSNGCSSLLLKQYSKLRACTSTDASSTGIWENADATVRSTLSRNWWDLKQHT
jgi:hypothetical protein